MEPIIDSFTISSSFETNNGGKASHFLSINMKMPSPVSMEEFKKVQADAAKYLSQCLIQQAVMRGCLSIEEAIDRSKVVGHNHEQFVTSLMNKKRTIE
jgi:hypothetical protein